jgi:hypothetical protein
MKVTYNSHEKRTHNLKVIKFGIFRNSKYDSKLKKFKSPLPLANGM